MLPVLRAPLKRKRNSEDNQDAKKRQRTGDSSVVLTSATRNAEPFGLDAPCSTGFHDHGPRGHGNAVESPGAFMPVSSNTSGATVLPCSACRTARKLVHRDVIPLRWHQTLPLPVTTLLDRRLPTLKTQDERDYRGTLLRIAGVAAIYRATLGMSADGEPIAEVPGVRSGGPAVDVKRKRVSEDDQVLGKGGG